MCAFDPFAPASPVRYVRQALTSSMQLLPIGPDVLAAVHALNNAHATELSWLEPDDLALLLGQAFYARRVGTLDAFLLAFDQTAKYESPNYRWFRDRYDYFVATTVSSAR